MGLFNKKKKNVDQKQNTQRNMRKVFKKVLKANLQYISSNEKDVDVIKRQFVKNDSRFYLTIGKIDCPTGKLTVADPFPSLSSDECSPVLNIQVPVGTYPVEVSICRSKELGVRMCTVRLKIKETEAILYKLANPTEESALLVDEDGALSLFLVESGMIFICDEQVEKEYTDFLSEWYKEHPNGNHYCDYFAELFKESVEKFPQYQRETGDFIEWENPNTKNKLVMVASGLGDGLYQSYWGYDSNNDICELIVPLVNPDLFEL